ncbi:MAG: TIGR01212 family radical SAM protein, partial [Aquificae bacterium]|nr:TIGR01212 family radical SAM protein [Aquificota bacterium]
LELLESYTEKGLEVWIEYGLQSANFGTLKRINRQHGVSDLVDAVLRAKRHNLKVCVHTIVGLPGEGREDFLETAKLIAALPVDGIKIHPIYVMKNTGLAKLFLEGKFRTLSLGEYASYAADMLEVIPSSVVVHRLTAEAERDKLLSPDYCVYERKLDVINAIELELLTRNSRQGAKEALNRTLTEVKGALGNLNKLVESPGRA